MGWLTEHPLLAWLSLALALGAFEVATIDFVFLMFVGGALAGALVAALGGPFVLQVIVAVVVAVLLLGVVRPIVVRRVHVGDPTLTGSAALVGRDARVVETVTDVGGRIKLGGEVWSARVASEGVEALLPGRSVRVLSIQGATAVVAPAAPEPEIP